jgi:hypothetical protein
MTREEASCWLSCIWWESSLEIEATQHCARCRPQGTALSQVVSLPLTPTLSLPMGLLQEGVGQGALVASGYAAQLPAFPSLPESFPNAFFQRERSSKQPQHPVPHSP